MIPVVLVMPSLSFVASTPAAAMGLMALLTAIQNVAVNFTFASGNVLVNEAALRPELKTQVGSINGAGHMFSSAVRAIGPATAGSLWSMITAADIQWGVFVPFLICLVLAVANIKLYSSI